MPNALRDAVFEQGASVFEIGDASRAKSSAEMALALDARHEKSLARLEGGSALYWSLKNHIINCIAVVFGCWENNS